MIGKIIVWLEYEVLSVSVVKLANYLFWFRWSIMGASYDIYYIASLHVHYLLFDLIWGGGYFYH